MSMPPLLARSAHHQHVRIPSEDEEEAMMGGAAAEGGVCSSPQNLSPGNVVLR